MHELHYRVASARHAELLRRRLPDRSKSRHVVPRIPNATRWAEQNDLERRPKETPRPSVVGIGDSHVGGEPNAKRSHASYNESHGSNAATGAGWRGQDALEPVPSL